MQAGAPVRPRIVQGLRLVRLVGSGGEGEVWEARDAAGRRRALKLVRPDALAADADARSAHLLRIDHPALVRVYAGGRLRGGPLDGWGWLEMAYVDGPSLQDAPADPDVLARLWPLAEALDLLHAGEWSAGLPLVHRDVKPANLVDAGGDLVLVDPSTLRGVDAGELTRIGTPLFSAPEVVTGRIGPAADVYSFAATVVALVTGARRSALATLLELVAELDLPAGVQAALSLDPRDRPGSCRAVLAAGTQLAEDPTLVQALDDVLDTVAPPVVAGWDGPSQQAASGDAPVRQRSPWPWALLYALLLLAPLAGWALGRLGGADVAAAAAAVAAAHLLACLGARAPAGLTLLLPPLAWAFLLADRVTGGPRRRDWARATLSGTTLATVAAGLLALPALQAGDGRAAAATVVAGALLPLAALAAAGARGLGGLLLRVVLLPAWLLGAAVVAGGAVLLAPVAGTAGLAGRTLVSLVEVVRGPPPTPAMMPAGPTTRWER